MQLILMVVFLTLIVVGIVLINKLYTRNLLLKYPAGTGKKICFKLGYLAQAFLNGEVPFEQAARLAFRENKIDTDQIKYYRVRKYEVNESGWHSSVYEVEYWD